MAGRGGGHHGGAIRRGGRHGTGRGGHGAPTPGERHGGSPHNGGFTLIELIVTLLLLAVMAAVAAPAFRSERAPADLDEAADRLEALFRMARDSAIVSAVPVTVVVDSASGLVWIDARPSFEPRSEDAAGDELGNPATLSDAGTIQPLVRAPARGESLDLPPTVTMEVSRARAHFTFHPGGSAVGDSVLLRAATGELRLLTLDPWTGHVVSH